MGVLDRLLKPKKEEKPQAPAACVLIVSDDNETAMQVRQDLLDGGFSVCYGTTVDAAITILDTSTHVEMIIGDFANPETDGKAFLKTARIRLGRKDFPPVVFLMDSESDELVAKAMGVSEVLSKPVNKDALIACAQKRAVVRAQPTAVVAR